MSELAGGAIGRATLYAKGATEDQAMAFLQPIVIDSHVLNNPWLNYSVYLSNTIIPGILMLLIFMTTVYTIGSEMKTTVWGSNLPVRATVMELSAMPIHSFWVLVFISLPMV